MYILIKILINAVALMIAVYLLKPRVQIQNFSRALILSAILVLVGSGMKEAVGPWNAATFGLLNLVINAFLLVVVDYFLKGFRVQSFLWALVLALLLALINGFLNWLF